MEKVASRSAACVFFIEIGNITEDVADNVSGMIVEFGIRVGFCIV